MTRSDVKELIIVVGLGVIGVYAIGSVLTATATHNGINQFDIMTSGLH